MSGLEDTAMDSTPREATLNLQNVLCILAGLGAGMFLGWLLFARGLVPQDQSPQVMALAKTEEALGTAHPSSGDTGSGLPGLGISVDVNERMGTLPWENEKDYLPYMAEKTTENADMLKARYALAMRLIQTKELQGNTIEAFLRTPREDFVREQNISRAYADTWMPIGYGATITDPDVVSMMTTTLDIQPGHRVLEVGTGSGYQSAIISNLSNFVFSLEIIEPLQKETHALYEKLSPSYPQYRNIHRKLGDGYYGWEEYAPFDRIIVTCAIDHLPPPLLRQLALGGTMVVPLGPPGRQHIMEVTKTTDSQGNEVLKRRDAYNGLQVKFIPFRDEAGTSYSGMPTL